MNDIVDKLKNSKRWNWDREEAVEEIERLYGGLELIKKLLKGQKGPVAASLLAICEDTLHEKP